MVRDGSLYNVTADHLGDGRGIFPLKPSPLAENRFQSMIPNRGIEDPMPTTIHPTSIVSPEAEIGEDVEIGPFCVVEADAKIGDGCVLQGHNRIDRYTILGPNNSVEHGAVLGTPPQDGKWEKGSVSYLEIGEGNSFREYCTVNRATGEGEKTRIGSRCMLMAYTHVAHNCKLGDEVVMANAASLSGHVEIQDWVVLGGFSVFPQFVRLGKGSFMGGSSGIRQDLPPFIRASGQPGAPVGINVVGMERRGVPRDSIKAVHQTYKLLYRSGLKLEDALDQIEGNHPDVAEVKLIVAFVRESKNGIVRPRPLR